MGKPYLVGGFNPSEKYSSKWESSPNRGEHKNYLKPPPSYISKPPFWEIPSLGFGFVAKKLVISTLPPQKMMYLSSPPENRPKRPKRKRELVFHSHHFQVLQVMLVSGSLSTPFFTHLQLQCPRDIQDFLLEILSVPHERDLDEDLVRPGGVDWSRCTGGIPNQKTGWPYQ